MKKIIIFLIVFSTSILSQDKYYTFTELKGMEDNEGNTHLFYRMFDSIGSFNGSNYKEENSVYHLDLFDNKDTLFLFDGGGVNTLTDPEFFRIIDYEFFKNNPEEFIYSGVSTIVDPVPYIKRFDEDESSYSFLGEERNGNIEISKQNDSLLFASIAGEFLKSTTGGRSWEAIQSLYEKHLISVNPLNDSIIFFQEENNLYKSINRGDNLSKTDTFYTDFHSFIYDKDEDHIYRLIKDNYQNHLSVSGNKGEAFSWQKKYSSENQIYISVDTSQIGHIYLADGRFIYHSSDYGETFNLFKELDRRIVGIYKKPGSDKLYAATKYDLYEITPDTIINIKHLKIDPDLFSWFPMEVGNKWIYSTKILLDGPEENIITLWEIDKQIIYKNNKYFKFNDNNYFRVDSSEGKIFKAYFHDDSLSSEELFVDLTVSVKDTFYLNEFNPIYMESEEPINLWNKNYPQRNYYGLFLISYQFSLVKNIGLSYEFWWELSGSESVLKGAVLTGVVYGDTTLVGINDPKENLPAEFSLSQNYPNPFNPSTKISWQSPVSSRQILKVYDILGNEVAVLLDEGRPAGEYEVEFDTSKYNLSSGVYFYQLRVEAFTQTKKLILMK